MLDGVSDELFDTGVGNGGFIGHLVVGTTGFDGIEQVLGVCHGGGCFEWPLRGGVWLLIWGSRGRGEEGGRTRGFIVGQDSSNGIDEGCRLPKQMVRLARCHVTELGDQYCEKEQCQGDN